MKGKDMVLSVFLSRQKTDDSNPHEIITISFSLRRVLHKNYYKLDNLIEIAERDTEKFLVQTRSQAKSSGIKVPEVNGTDKGLILIVEPEHHKSVVAQTTCPIPPICHARPMHQMQPIDHGLSTSIVPTVPMPRIGQGRSGIRRKPNIAPPTSKPIQIPVPPIPTPAPRETQSLPEPVVQL